MKKRFQKTALLLAATMTVSMVTAACGSSNNLTEAGKTNTTGAVKKDAADVNSGEKIEITFMNLWAEGNTENIAVSVRAAMEKFQQENPNITIKEESIGDQSAYYTKLKTLAASNSLPDVFVCKGSELSTFAKNDLAASLDDILNGDAEWKDGYIPSSFDDLSTDGKIYGVPYSMLSTHVIYYNKQILADVGYDTFPTTWDDFTAMLGKIKEKGITPIALGNKEQWVVESCILSALGDRFTGTDWFKGIMDQSGPKFTDPEFVQALTALQKLGTSGVFNSDMNSINNDQQKTLYFNGKAAMFMEGSWAVGAVMAGPKDIAANTEVAVLPAVNGGRGDAAATSGGSGSGFAVGIKNYDAKKDAIAAFLKAISGPEYAKAISELGEPAAYVVKDYDQSNVSELAVKYSEMAAGLTFTPIYDSFLDPAVISVMNSGLQELLIGAVTPEDLAQRIQDEFDKVY